VSSKVDTIGGPTCGCSGQYCKGSSYTEKPKREKPKKASKDKNRQSGAS